MGTPRYATSELFWGYEHVVPGQIRDSDDPVVKQFPQCFSDDWHDSPTAHFTEKPAPKKKAAPKVETATQEPGEVRDTTDG